MKRHFFLASLALFSTGLLNSLYGAEVNHAKEYKKCFELVASDNPEDGFNHALTWKSFGGGEAAEHCLASALINMQRYQSGAQRLEKLADDSRQTKEFKAQILAQAAQAWFLDQNPSRARAVLDSAIELDPTAAELYLDRGHILSTEQYYTDALNDFNKAISLDDQLVDAYVFRGTLYRLTEKFEEATRDISLALDLAPNNQEAMLERGMLYRIDHQDQQARQMWLDAINQDPLTEAAEIARLNLEKMDIHN